MKYTMFMIAASAAALAMASCSRTKPVSMPVERNSTDAVYTGVLPGADVDGVRYTLLLDFDDKGNRGEYDIVQTYFVDDSTGVRDMASFAGEGDFTVGHTDAGKPYITLSDDGAGRMFFLMDTDSTLVMTDASITPVNTPGMNYTLSKAR